MILSELINSTEVVVKLALFFSCNLEGVSAQNRRYLNAYFGLKFLNLNDLVAVLIQDFIEQQNPVKTLTHTPVLENGVNSS